MGDKHAVACFRVRPHATGEMHANFCRVQERSNASLIHGPSERTALRAESAGFAI